MRNNINESFNEDKSLFMEDYGLTNLNDVCACIVEAAKNVSQELVPGLPKSVYQLKLLNYLSSKGLQLETESSQLEMCANDNPERDLIIVNGSLVIECVVDSKLAKHYEKRIMFDIEKNGHVLGVLVNFANAESKDNLSKVFHSKTYH